MHSLQWRINAVYALRRKLCPFGSGMARKTTREVLTKWQIRSTARTTLIVSSAVLGTGLRKIPRPPWMGENWHHVINWRRLPGFWKSRWMGMPFIRTGITDAAQVKEKNKELSFSVLNLRGSHDTWIHLAVGYIDLPFWRRGLGWRIRSAATSVYAAVTGWDGNTQGERVGKAEKKRLGRITKNTNSKRKYSSTSITHYFCPHPIEKILYQHTLDFSFFLRKVGMISPSCIPYCHEDHLISGETWWVEQAYLLLVLPEFHWNACKLGQRALCQQDKRKEAEDGSDDIWETEMHIGKWQCI